MRARVVVLPDLHSAHEVTRVTSTVYSRAERASGGMERALTLFLGNGYLCLCSAGVMIVVDWGDRFV